MKTPLRQYLAFKFMHAFGRKNGSAPHDYHQWFYNSMVWDRMEFMGVKIHKSPMDLWNYQEILYALKPSLLIEFGTHIGGSALYFAMAMRRIGKPFRLLSVDTDHEKCHPSVLQDPDIELMRSSSSDQTVAAKIAALKVLHPGPIFAILDSDHRKQHVMAEMELLRPLLSAGDYMIVEDSNINGHPVLPGWGPGPYEAIEEYERRYPGDYAHDSEREEKFGWTAAPRGFLIRQ